MSEREGQGRAVKGAELPGQLSNPRMASGAVLRCPECQRFQHPDNTTCSLERDAIQRAAEGAGFWKARP